MTNHMKLTCRHYVTGSELPFFHKENKSVCKKRHDIWLSTEVACSNSSPPVEVQSLIANYRVIRRPINACKQNAFLSHILPSVPLMKFIHLSSWFVTVHFAFLVANSRDCPIVYSLVARLPLNKPVYNPLLECP